MNVSEIKLLFKSLSEERKLSYYISGLHGELVLDINNYISIEVYIYEDKLKVYFSNNRFEKNSLNFNYMFEDFNLEDFVTHSLNILKNNPLYRKLFIYMFGPSTTYSKDSGLKIYVGKLRYIKFQKETKSFDYHKLNGY